MSDVDDKPRVVQAKRGKRPVKVRARRGQVRLETLTIVSDHRVLTDHDGDWTLGGSTFPVEKKLSETRPITHTKGEPIGLKIVLTTKNARYASMPVTVTGKSSDAVVTFNAQGQFDGGQADLFVTADSPLPDKITRLTPAATVWHAKVDGKTYALGTKTWDETFVIFGEPFHHLGTSVLQDGVTIRRMRAAVDLIENSRGLGGTSSSTPHEIIGDLMKRFPTYVIKPFVDKSPQKFAPMVALGGPKFLEGNHGGAWAITENPDLAGECQAIVRLIAGILHQTGITDKAETVLVYADESKQGKVAKVDIFSLSSAGGLGKPQYSRRRTQTEGHNDWEELRLLPQSTVPLGQFSNTIAPNTYEACLRLQDGGKRVYYPGGFHGNKYSTAQEVLEGAFRTLAWVSGYPSGFVVWKIVARYP